MRNPKTVLLGFWVVHVLVFCLHEVKGQDNQSAKNVITEVSQSSYEFELASGERIETQQGTVDIPENRNAPTSRKINLRFLRLSARDGAKGTPTIYLAGGPGQSAIAAAKSRRYQMFDSLRDVGDVILFDQRGTGLSDGLPKWSSRIPFPKDQPKSIDARFVFLGDARWEDLPGIPRRNCGRVSESFNHHRQQCVAQFVL